MPWHAPKGTTTNGRFGSLTREVASVWDSFDKDKARAINANQRRETLQSLGVRTSTSLLAAEWSKNEHDAVRRVFDRFDVNNDASIDIKELVPALTLLGVDLGVEQIRELLKKYDDDRSGVLELGEVRARARRSHTAVATRLNACAAESRSRLCAQFRKLCSRIRQEERKTPPPPPASPAPGSRGSSRPASRVGTPMAHRAHDTMLSSDDGGAVPGGAVSPATSGLPSALPGSPMLSTISGRTRKSFGAGTGGGMALNESAVDLEISHVRRMLVRARVHVSTRFARRLGWILANLRAAPASHVSRTSRVRVSRVLLAARPRLPQPHQCQVGGTGAPGVSRGAAAGARRAEHGVVAAGELPRPPTISCDLPRSRTISHDLPHLVP